MKEAINVTPVKGEDYGSPARNVGTGKQGLYKRPKKKKTHEYSRKAPNYHANTDTTPGSSPGGSVGGSGGGGI